MSSILTKDGRRRFLELLAENKRSEMRRARVLAARRFGWASVPRRACLAGAYDSGNIIREYRDEDA